MASGDGRGEREKRFRVPFQWVSMGEAGCVGIGGRLVRVWPMIN